ncbi:MAG: DUF1800 domain-containing protein [Magnetospirillum sp.]|nr:DUF1800 domain-containing protein [Magnetospirillum sp.]
MPRDDAHIAANRFAMGMAPGDRAAITGDPRGWVLAQLAQPDAAPGLDRFADSATLLVRALKARRDKDPDARKSLRQDYMAEAAARTRAGALSATPARERLVRLWSNHFTISVQRPAVLPLAGAFEREAIRPHVTGRFLHMLRAVVRHPAMLLYLDNARSIGPQSAAGERHGRGLNENLARELMELHTLGPDGGYSQADVEHLARILTGWTLDAEAGGFRFAPRLHQPGAKTVLGIAFHEAGEAEGDRALEMLARHPATARMVATRLARHYVADDPPPALVDRLVRRYLDSDGDLGEVTRLLVEGDEAWAEPLVKMRAPDDLLAATLRAFGGAPEAEDRALVSSLAVMGQTPWAAPSPAGWPDRAEAWAAPEALMLRLEWARKAAPALARRGHFLWPDADLSEATRRIVSGAATKAEALFLILASRDFQRR